ncbi:hypothetical protein PR202_gb02796 [Eleusine coracana subsp. coracana]|uniref:F-box domain-containing protein n=1 Tax=Eleusine coracana subsp. coracana TaxID=191504 RepID=A0AAV5E079_ELECO|nr:hypothetical protein QOZ80_8BG0664530 [Eleusine coracana subsp. coracana]GJN15852.1 hypothetical protein PR202_gb02796 [Eleusine coracana subsp. coracana]
MADADVFSSLTTDAFMEILLRLHPSKRWRLRLVCRLWRDVIQDRMPAPSRPVPLAFVVNYSDDYVAMSACAYTVHDLKAGRFVEVWRSNNFFPTCTFDYRKDRNVYTGEFDTAMVGTSNGVMCLCDNTVSGGAISLVNPVTGESLAVPRLPGSSAQWVWRARGTTMIPSWHRTYSFGYDQTTERYTIVHVPCDIDNNTGGFFNAVQVFTFTPGADAAATTWRDVPVTAGTCCVDAGLVSIDGATYWITKGGVKSVVSFDHREERVVFTKALPKRDEEGYGWHLTDVHGRLGVVSSSVDHLRTPAEKTEVCWVLVGDGKEWIQRYSVQVSGVLEWIARPHFAHGDHVLLAGSNQMVYGHMLPNTKGRVQSGELRSVRVSVQMPGVAVSGMGGKIMGIFSYVWNTEPFTASSWNNKGVAKL